MAARSGSSLQVRRFAAGYGLELLGLAICSSAVLFVLVSLLIILGGTGCVSDPDEHLGFIMLLFGGSVCVGLWSFEIGALSRRRGRRARGLIPPAEPTRGAMTRAVEQAQARCTLADAASTTPEDAQFTPRKPKTTE